MRYISLPYFSTVATLQTMPDLMNPKEVQQRLERLFSAARLYSRVWPDLRTRPYSRAPKWAKQLINALENMPKLKSTEGLVAVHQMSEDLWYFFGFYLMVQQKNISERIQKKILSRDLSTHPRINGNVNILSGLTMRSENISQRIGNSKGGPFEAALNAVGALYESTGKTIQKKLRATGLPYRVNDIKEILFQNEKI